MENILYWKKQNVLFLQDKLFEFMQQKKTFKMYAKIQIQR